MIKKSEYFYSDTNELLKLVEKLYDDTGKEIMEKTTSYLYDANGNEIRQKVSYIQPHATDKYQYTTGNPYGNQEDHPISNMIEKVSNTYDGFNHLKQVDKIRDGERVTVEYIYNGDGLRTQKVVKSSKEGYTSKVTNYIYDRQHVILETDGSNSLKTRYVRGLNYIARYSSANQLSYYLYNGHGDVVQTVSETGEVQNQYDYDIFGNPILTVEVYENAIRYAGEFYDAETGLYYLRARYYDPYTGRFISEDSYWGEDQTPHTLNLYVYVHNDPINFYDPTGHWEQGDETLSSEDQNKIKALTDAYFSADNQEEKQKIHEEAEKIRKDAERLEKILRKTGDYDSNTDKNDSFVTDLNTVYENSEHEDDDGKKYITGDEWRKISKKHDRRSKGTSEVISERVEKKWTGQRVHSIESDINIILSDAETSFDYTIGSIGYVEETDQRAKESGNFKTMKFIINDTEDHNYEFQTVKDKYSFISDKEDNFTRFYKKVNELVGGIEPEDIDEDIHYFRNKLNKAPSSLDEMAALNQQLDEDKKWVLMTPLLSMFHMYDGDGYEGEKNVKFVSADGYFEAVYNEHGELLTDENDPINMGTYNYFDPVEHDGLDGKHAQYDVDPYYAWGNTENVERRGKDAENAGAIWNYTKYTNNRNAFLHRRDVEKQVYPERFRTIEQPDIDLPDFGY